MLTIGCNITYLGCLTMYHSGVNIITQRGSTNLERVFVYMSNKPQSHKLAVNVWPLRIHILVSFWLAHRNILVCENNKQFRTSLYYKP